MQFPVTWEGLREAWFKDKVFFGENERFDAEQEFLFFQRNHMTISEFDAQTPAEVGDTVKILVGGFKGRIGPIVGSGTSSGEFYYNIKIDAFTTPLSYMREEFEIINKKEK